MLVIVTLYLLLLTNKVTNSDQKSEVTVTDWQNMYRQTLNHSKNMLKEIYTLA